MPHLSALSPVSSPVRRLASGATAFALVLPMAHPAQAQEIANGALSPMQMFLGADIVVQAVMVGLVLASVLTWTVFFMKLAELALAHRQIARSLGGFAPGQRLQQALAASRSRRDPVSRMVRAAAGEHEASARALARAGTAGLKERVTSHLARIEAQEGRRITRGTGFLAIVGSTAPFVGLFGTVWGIMNSFISIAESQTTNLAVVAPGIAEALLATGIGLVAAIPAVVFYNLFARATAGYRLRLGDGSAAVQRLVSRELDLAAAGG